MGPGQLLRRRASLHGHAREKVDEVYPWSADPCVGPVDEIDLGAGEQDVVGPQIRVQQGFAGTGVVCGRFQFGEELSLAVQPWRAIAPGV